MILKKAIEEIVLGPELNGVLITPEEFDAVTEHDELYRYEVIHGVLVVNPICLPEQQGPSGPDHTMRDCSKDSPQVGLVEGRIVLGPELNGVLMTPEEFDGVSEYDDLYRYELIRGVLIVNPIPSPEERDPNEELGHLLRTYREHHPQGRCLDKTLFEEYVRLPHGRRRADRVIWIGLGRTPDRLRDIPTVVAEFVSAGRRSWLRDYVEKRDEYLAIGVVEYWIINRFTKTLTIFRKTDQGISEQEVQANEVYRPALLPGFELSLAKLLSCASDWESP